MAERAPDDLPRRRRSDPPANADAGTSGAPAAPGTPGTPAPEAPAERRRASDAAASDATPTIEVPAGSQVQVDERTGDVNVTLPPPPPPPRGLGRRTLDTVGRLILNLTVVLLGLVAVGLFVLWFLTNTDPGRERVRTLVIDQFESHTNGRLHIGKVTGNLLEGFTFHAFAITEKNGAPFMAADSVHARYAFRGLLRKRIELDDVVIWRPVAVLDNPPNGKWNFQRIFPGRGPQPPHERVPGFGDWITATDVRVVQGDLVVKSTWHVDTAKTPAQQRASIREALAGERREVIVRHPSGFQKVMRFRQLNATLPSVILADPRYRWRIIDVATASLIAQPFHPPYADVRDLKGTFRMDGDSVWWREATVRTPGSQLVADGRYWFMGDDAWIRGHGERIALADWRWAYPRLPSEGGGPADIEYRFNKKFMTFRARDMDVRIGAQRARGSVGMTFVDVGPRDTLVVHDTHLRVANVQVKLLEQLIDFESPRQGTVSGTVDVGGGVHAMRVNGDVEFRDVRSGYNHLVGGGTIAFLGGKDEPGVAKDVVLRDARFRLLPLQVYMLTQSLKPPPIPIKGTVTGTVRLDYWSIEKGGTVVGDIVHVDRGDRSAFTGRATLRYAATPPWFDVDGTVHPISLALANRFAPSLALRGYGTGPLKVRGTLDDLVLDTDMQLGDGGALAARGRIAMGPQPPFYDLALRMRELNVGALRPSMPSSSLTGTAELRGRGTTPETLEGTYAVDLHASRWDTLAVDSVVGRVRVANGLLGIDRLAAAARGIEATAQGTFGMRAGREGTLSYRVNVADLGALRSVIPGLAGADTGVVQPRPGLLAERVRRARADSARIAKATEIERIVTGKKVPPVVVDTPRAVPRGAVGGTLAAAGTARGWVRDFDLRGRAAGERVLARGNYVRRLAAEYAWTHAMSPRSSLALGVDADSLSVMGFALDTLNARLTYDANKTGRLELAATQGTERDYSLRGDFVLHPEHNEAHVSDATFRFDSTRWALARPATIGWGARGIAVQNVDLRSNEQGRIWVNGLLPTEGVANLDVALDDVPLANLATIAQSDVDVTGRLTLRGHMGGTLRAPVFNGSFGVPDATLGGTTVPQLRGTFAYADQSLTTKLQAVRGDAQPPLAVVDATIPVNLALSGVSGPRFSGEGIRVDAQADSLPLDLIPRFTDVVSDVKGFAAGRIVLRGSLDRPSLTGALTLRNAEATIVATGSRVTGINGAVRMLNDTVRVDSLVGHAGGELRVSGGLAVGDWREPTFDLHFNADEAEVLKDNRGEMFVSAALALTGPMKNSYLSGQVTVLHGVLYLPQSRNVENISPGDPALFAVLDTTIIAEKELLPAESPLLEHLRIDVDLQVNRDTWVRTRDANVEVFSDGLIHVHRERAGPVAEGLALTGVMATERGEYRLFSKRFQVRRGSAVFMGGAELNPTVQATAEYEVRPPGREAVNIRIVVGGTLRRLRIALESDAQPPMSQSDILSFLAFSKETASLLDFEGSPLSSRSGNPNLIGLTKTAGRRLATVALGLAVDEVEGEAGRDLGVDVINITPEEVPTDFGMTGFQDFLLGTRLEVGKYINPQTFVAMYGSLSTLTGATAKAPPGARLEHRTGKGWRIETSVEPQLRLREPTLKVPQDPVSPVTVFGLFLIREWRF